MRLWSFAVVQLGLSEDRFYRLTLRQWDALLQEHERKRQQTDQMLEFMVASLTAATINFSARAPEQMVQASDLMPSCQTEQRQKRRRPSRAAIAASMRAFFGSMIHKQ